MKIFKIKIYNFLNIFRYYIILHYPKKDTILFSTFKYILQ